MTVVLKDRFLKLTGTSQEDDVVELIREITKKNQKVDVTQLKGGITNQLLLAETEDGLKLLVRAFGKGTDNFIDRNREFVVHSQLQKMGLAPRLYGKFGNGLVYGYVAGSVVDYHDLSKTYTMSNVARRLAQWHAALKPKSVSEGLSKEGSSRPLGDIWSVMKEWVDQCPEGVLPISLTELKHEFSLLKERIGSKGGVEVMGHCDLLSANILLPASTDPREGIPVAPNTVEDPKIVEEVRSEAAFIDYEYAIPCPRAFDIANHFQEWQGYECEKERVPAPNKSSKDLVYWCEEYLKVTGLLSSADARIDDLIDELKAWWGMPGFYWGVWSAIQSKSSDIDFGYREYAGKRFQEFLDWKNTYK